MKTFEIENIFTGKTEKRTVNDMTSFRVGDKVRHANEGVHAGSSGIIKHGVGEIKELSYEGFGFLGHTIVALVEWEFDGNLRLNVCLLQDADEEQVTVNPDALRLFKN